MKLSSDSSVQDAAGRITLQEFPEGLPAILSVLLDHPEATPECRIAFSLLSGPVRGIRALSIASGLHQEQVWEITAGYDGGLSPHGLVRTIERGTSWTSEGREKGSYALAESVRLPHTKSTTYKNPPTPLGEETLKGLKDLGTYRVRYAHRFSEQAVMDLANPALDLWRGRDKGELGGEGWRVGVLLGFSTVDLSAKEWAELAGGTDKAKRLAKKLEKHGVLARTGKARATRYALDWSIQLRMVEENAEDLMSRVKKLQNDHAKEQRRIQRPLTADELEVRRRAKSPAQYAAYLQDALDEAESPEHRKDLGKLLHVFAGATEADWRRWMELDEQPEPGIVPDTVAGFATPPNGVANARPAREAAVVQEDPELLARVAEMRKRIVAWSYA
ncbi:hypothetical protein ACFYXS_02710 [Streptomyces sp. NPDC002574]|uniref:hypothetical protein n=1 Tax=Streptomyces sp. NPDC002574 TaxID=3364652 RepID=UPI003674DDB5